MFSKVSNFFTSTYNSAKSYVSTILGSSKSSQVKNSYQKEETKSKKYEKSQDSLDLKEVTLRAKLIDTAYKIYLDQNKFDNCNSEAKNFADQNDLSFKNFEILDISSNSQETSTHKLRSIAYVDHKSKKVIIAIAGTKDKIDLIDDAQLALGLTPNKQSPMDKFLENIISKLGDEASSYSFETTGHSLGAALSDYSSAKLFELGMKVERSTTFEHPGSKTLIKNNFQIDEVTSHIAFDVYNGNPNLITSSCDYPLATEVNLVGSKTPKKVGAFKYFLYKHFPTAARIIDGHSLKNFLEIHDDQKFKIDKVIGFTSARDGFSSPKDLLSVTFTTDEDLGSSCILVHPKDVSIIDNIEHGSSSYDDNTQILEGLGDTPYAA